MERGEEKTGYRVKEGIYWCWNGMERNLKSNFFGLKGVKFLGTN